MPFTEPLISAAALQSLLLTKDDLVILDCSFDLTNLDAGARSFQAGHLPGARYLHLERDLSGPKSPAGPIAGGRHPLPSRELLAERVGCWGIAADTPVVCYDAQGGPYAARAWWLLRWLGHATVAVLDGGVAAWVSAGGALEAGAAEFDPTRAVRPPYPATEAAMPTVSAEDLRPGRQRLLVVDARAGERFRGEVEPLDRVAGHIPGARHRFFKDNLTANGCFKPAEALRADFESFGVAAESVVHQCGSGVTACHNLLAMTHAGLPGARLYPGSWSEWSADPTRPVARS